MSPKSINSVTVPVCSLDLLDNGIIELRFIREYELQIEDIEAIQQAIVELDPSPKKILVIPGQYGGISKDARKVDFFEKTGSKDQLSVAIVSTQLHHRLVGTMYFKFFDPKQYNPKFFKNESQAREWLLLQ